MEGCVFSCPKPLIIKNNNNFVSNNLFLNCFDMLIIELIFFKNIILIYFFKKIILKKSTILT